MGSQPKRILVTRSVHQGSELATRLRALGMEPILIPTLEIAPPSSYAALDVALAGLDTFHWLLFTSANAVEAFQYRLTARHNPLSSSLKVAAIGPATARALKAIGLTTDLLPAQAVAESFAEALLPHAHQLDGTPTRFLLVRAEEGRELPLKSLCAAGAKVTLAPAYRTVVPKASLAALRDLFSRPENYPDVITFTSSSSVRNLLALLAEAGISLPLGIQRVSIGPITSQTLIEAGFPPHLEAEKASVAALAACCMNLAG